MVRCLVFCCLLAVAAGFQQIDYKGRYCQWPISVASKREAAAERVSAAATEGLYQLINATLQRATQGIDGGNLSLAAHNISDQADAILVARGASVSDDDVRSLVEEIVTQYGIESSAANILDDPLTAEVWKIETAVGLLYLLREQGLSREASGQSTDVTVAAISAVGKVLEISIADAEMIITFIADSNHPDDDDDEKRAEIKRATHGEGGDCNPIFRSPRITLSLRVIKPG